MRIRSVTTLACLGGLLGAALILDSVSVAIADPPGESEGDYPTDNCPYEYADNSETESCLPVPQFTPCSNVPDNQKQLCEEKMSQASFNEFPKNCEPSADYALACIGVAADCYRPTYCFYNPDTGKCKQDGGVLGAWTQAAKKTTLHCVVGGP